MILSWFTAKTTSKFQLSSIVLKMFNMCTSYVWNLNYRYRIKVKLNYDVGYFYRGFDRRQIVPIDLE